MLLPVRSVVRMASALALAMLCSFALGAGRLAHAGPAVEGKLSRATPAAAATPLPASTPHAGRPRPVSLLGPEIELWPDWIEASGNVMPWQESHVATEIGGLRVLSVLVNAGDVVRKGQVLARLNPAPVEVELEAANAQLAEAEAALAQAVATLDRANRLAPTGGVSRQELTLYETQKHTSEARLDAARAKVKAQQLRLDAATLLAPDDGVIASRSVAEGAIVQAGSELFRLIRQGRLEWRAEVSGETLLKLTPGQAARVKSPLGAEIEGRVRQVSPTVDLSTRKGLVYVDLPPEANLKAGLQVAGTLAIGERKVLVLPAAAVLCQAAACRVFKVGADNRIEALAVSTGRTKSGRVEISAGLDEQSRVVARDVAVLRPGDPVEVLTGQGVRH